MSRTQTQQRAAYCTQSTETETRHLNAQTSSVRHPARSLASPRQPLTSRVEQPLAMDILAQSVQSYFHKSRGPSQVGGGSSTHPVACRLRRPALVQTQTCIQALQRSTSSLLLQTSSASAWPCAQDEPPDLQDLLVRMAALLKSYPGGLTEACIVSELARAVRPRAARTAWQSRRKDRPPNHDLAVLSSARRWAAGALHASAHRPAGTPL